MLSRAVLGHILENDALTRGLTDPEARILIEWLVDRAELLAEDHPRPDEVVSRLCRRARAVARFVDLWCHRQERRSAMQLAASEQLDCPLPTSRSVDPCELMHDILTSEGARLAA